MAPDLSTAAALGVRSHPSVRSLHQPGGCALQSWRRNAAKTSSFHFQVARTQGKIGLKMPNLISHAPLAGKLCCMRLRKRKQHHATEIQLQMHISRLIFQSHPSRFQALQSVTKSQNHLIVQTKTQTSLDVSGSMGKETHNEIEIQQCNIQRPEGRHHNQIGLLLYHYCIRYVKIIHGT